MGKKGGSKSKGRVGTVSKLVALCAGSAVTGAVSILGAVVTAVGFYDSTLEPTNNLEAFGGLAILPITAGITYFAGAASVGLGRCARMVYQNYRDSVIS